MTETDRAALTPLRPTDADRCAELENMLFEGDDPWPAKAFLAEISVAHNHYVAARADGVLVGYAGISRLGRRPPFEYEVHTIGVDPAHQGPAGVRRRQRCVPGGAYRQHRRDIAVRERGLRADGCA
jgi:ribosomal-protein-alanine N-acetyltransferase